MHMVLVKAKEVRDKHLARIEEASAVGKESESEKVLHLRRTKATEVQLVKNLQALREPDVLFFAQALKG